MRLCPDHRAGRRPPSFPAGPGRPFLQRPGSVLPDPEDGHGADPAGRRRRDPPAGGPVYDAGEGCSRQIFRQSPSGPPGKEPFPSSQKSLRGRSGGTGQDPGGRLPRRGGPPDLYPDEKADRPKGLQLQGLCPDLRGSGDLRGSDQPVCRGLRHSRLRGPDPQGHPQSSDGGHPQPPADRDPGL